MNRSWSWRRYWSPWVNLGFLCSSLHIQYQCQQLWDCLYTDAGVLDDNCLAAALRGWNWVFFSPLVAHIVCEALRAGMWETVVIKVFCNSIKDSFPTVAPSALPPSLNCYPTPIPCLSMRACGLLQLQPPGLGPLLFNECQDYIEKRGICYVKIWK